MLATLPTRAQDVLNWTWPEIEPYYAELKARPVDAASIDEWLRDWSRLSELVGEVGSRLHLQYDQNNTDPEAERRYFSFLENVAPPAQAAENALSQKLLNTGLEPEGMAVPLRNIRAEVALFREANLPLFTEDRKTSAKYDKIVGAQTVQWDGEEQTLPKVRPVFEEADRTRRERAWWLIRERQLADRDAINAVWRELLPIRRQIAANAGCADYREYLWRAYQRFDYTPADTETFRNAIEAVVVPAATRIYERHRQRLGLETLRPWDLTNGEWTRPSPAPGQEPLHPYSGGEELAARSAAILHQVDPKLGGYFDRMRQEALLDLDNRKGKSPGGYCTYFASARVPYIFMNAVGTHTDVQVMLHEAGHAFHAFEASALPLYQQLNTPMEFNEVASMGMELLAAPYLTKDNGGFYTSAEAARARANHLEDLVMFWPYMAVVDGFQDWVYTHLDEAFDTDACDATWRKLWQRFLPAVDWSGLEAELVTGWHRKLHIFSVPLYYVEYGLAQAGAVQVWANALRDQAGAVASYRRALALGGTATLPQLYETAGARFAFDAETMGDLVGLIERTLAQLDPER